MERGADDCTGFGVCFQTYRTGLRVKASKHLVLIATPPLIQPMSFCTHLRQHAAKSKEIWVCLLWNQGFAWSKSEKSGRAMASIALEIWDPVLFFSHLGPMDIHFQTLIYKTFSFNGEHAVHFLVGGGGWITSPCQTRLPRPSCRIDGEAKFFYFWCCFGNSVAPKNQNPVHI